LTALHQQQPGQFGLQGQDEPLLGGAAWSASTGSAGASVSQVQAQQLQADFFTGIVTATRHAQPAAQLGAAAWARSAASSPAGVFMKRNARREMQDTRRCHRRFMPN
jgi:hypothetical protein